MSEIRKLLPYLLPYKSNLVLHILFHVLTAIFTVISIPMLIPFFQILFDRVDDATLLKNSRLDFIYEWFSELVETSGKHNALLWICVLIVTVFLLKNLFRYLPMYVLTPVRNGIIRDLRTTLYAKYVDLPLPILKNHPRGDLLARISSDVGEIEWSVLNVLVAFFRSPLIIIGCLGFMLLISVKLTVFVLLLLVFTVFVIGGISRSLKKQSKQAQGYLGNLISIVDESLNGARIIKMFDGQEAMEQNFSKTNEGYKILSDKVLRRRDLSSPLSEFLGISVVAILLWYGSLQVFDGVIMPETFFAFIIAFYQIIEPAKSFATAYYSVQKGSAAIDRVNQIIAIEETIVDDENARALQPFSQSLKFEKVYFSYHQDEVLRNINFEVEKGKKVAIVGSSGSGKSTIIDLMVRFYDPDAGSILLDGIDIKKVKLASLRDQFSMVGQDAIMFHDTIFQNICFGNQEKNRDKAIAVAKKANAHDFIMQLPGAYDYSVGKGGEKLSGGQRQRLSLARALYRDAPILVLDEATSSLDTESELVIQNAIRQAMYNKTVIVIAHRLSTIREVDEILILEDGEIVESGNHEELMSRKGRYYTMVELQRY